jgi:hypothetical protein
MEAAWKPSVSRRLCGRGKDRLIDPPSRFGPVENWEQHLAYLIALPSNTHLRAAMIQHARQVIADKRRNPMDPAAEAAVRDL